MAGEILTLKKRDKLISPEEIIGGREFDGDHVNHGIEIERGVSHGWIGEFNPRTALIP